MTRGLFFSAGGLLAAHLLAGGPPAIAASDGSPLEQAVKAGYVTKFAPFVEWPATAFAAPSSPLMLCVGGRDIFGSVLDEFARGLRVRGHPMQIRRIGDVLPPGGCHILFIGAGPSDALLAQATGQPVLTVTDGSAGVDGGMIRFVRQGGRIRFEIHNGAARAVRLVISSKLLGLAVAVIR